MGVYQNKIILGQYELDSLLIKHTYRPYTCQCREKME